MHIGKYCTDGNRGFSDQSWSGESSVGIDVPEAYWDVAVVRSSHSSAFAQQG